MSSNTFTENKLDKFSRCGNKGTIGCKIPRSDFIKPGEIPDNITTSPYSLAERITIDYLFHDPNVSTTQLLMYCLHLRVRNKKINDNKKIDNNYG
ncbi:RNA polymerase subunit B [Moumouvirus goulette]|uniref:RNA polymerase subunit B n=1 Tax=Moumouvirus goulette TaxID=1247379 RepID=M1PCD1_9VIRU|nr:RNA polymerase subunit B [Moumouvirus goulette]AGF85629.1 RNA polymerase subunit B [Moumouvirus goulette]